LKSPFFTLATTTVFAAFIVLVATAAQAPQSGPPTQPPSSPAVANAPQIPGAPAKRTHPAPTNLQVLPKDLTGEQVHEIMEHWEASLGAHCGTCHAVDPKNIGPNGRPRLNYADDSKPEKITARKMYQMTEGINLNYISKIDSSGAPVTCGTCHRGHLGPEPFVPAPEDHDHDHDHPAPAPQK
jgi:hypothetical protein